MLVAFKRVKRFPGLRLLVTLLAMSGWRLERVGPAWLALGVASFVFGAWLQQLGSLAWSSTYWVCTLAFYYLGNGFVLGYRGVSKWAIRTMGESRALGRYDMLLGLMFIHQGLGLSAMASHRAPSSLLTFGPFTTLLGAVLIAIGATTKTWATLAVGIDAYYYHDLFLRRARRKLVRHGPYRYLANPMYGVGQLHAYGYALIAESVPGLLAAAICHALIYVFHVTVERPFVRRLARGQIAARASRRHLRVVLPAR